MVRFISVCISFWVNADSFVNCRWDYSELVNTRNARYRTFMMLLMGFFGQWSGNGLGYETFSALFEILPIQNPV